MALKSSKKTVGKKPAKAGVKAGKTTSKATTAAPKKAKAKTLQFKDISPFALKAMGEGRGTSFAENPTVEGAEEIVSHLRANLLKAGGLTKAKASTKVEKSAKASGTKAKAGAKPVAGKKKPGKK